MLCSCSFTNRMCEEDTRRELIKKEFGVSYFEFMCNYSDSYFYWVSAGKSICIIEIQGTEKIINIQQVYPKENNNN